MSTLRISDAPLLPDVDGSEKIPTGGRGDYAVSIDQIKNYAQGGVPQQIEDHINDTNNPHQVTKAQVGLGNVDNTSDLDKPVSTATQISLDLKSDQTYVDEALSSLNTQASKFYPTLAEANADIANIILNQPVQVGESGNNGGLYYKATAEATTLTKSPFDPLTQAKTYTDSTSLKKHSLIGNVNLNTFITGGLYFQSISANATAANNYPSHAQNIQSEIAVIGMTANTIMQIIKASGAISTRFTYNGGTSWNTWATSLGQADYTALSNLTSTLESKLSKRLEWFISGADGVVSYDKDTKTLSWNRPLIASYNLATTRRINIAAGSVTFAGTGYEVLFLDTTSLPATGTVTAEMITSCLKIASYNSPAATAFTDKITQIPIAKLNPQGEIVACAGFLPLTSTAAEVQKETFAYNKIADRINLYLPASNGNLINYLLRHDVKPFEPAQSQSQLDMWRFERALEVNRSYTTLQEIVTYGEWEFTMREQEYPADHVGGVHGDEVLTSAYFLVDGVYKDAVSWTGVGEAKEIRLQLNSVIYRLNTQVEIAEHYKELVITKDGITANQELVTKIQLNPDRFWLAMLPTNRIAANSVQVSKRDLRNGILRDVSAAGFTRVYTPLKNGSYVNVSGDKYSTSVEISNLQGVLETADIYVSNDAAYNKIYVSAIGGASSGVTLPAGTKISWTTKYRVDAS